MNGTITEWGCLQLGDEAVPTANIFQSKIGQRRNTEDDHEELKDFVIDCRAQTALEDIGENDHRRDDQPTIVIPSNQCGE